MSVASKKDDGQAGTRRGGLGHSKCKRQIKYSLCHKNIGSISMCSVRRELDIFPQSKKGS